jgi:hypothetical protein
MASGIGCPPLFRARVRPPLYFFDATDVLLTLEVARPGRCRSASIRARMFVRPRSVTPRAYLNAEQLSVLTPWSPDAIRRMVQRGVLHKGEHFFQPLGPGTHRLYKWSAIVELIESNDAEPPMAGAVERRAEPEAINVEEATARLRRLLD